MTKREAEGAEVLCEAATEGPWRVHRYSGQPHILAGDPTCRGAGTTVVLFEPCQLRDAEFMVNARTALPAALKMLKRAAGIIGKGCNSSEEARCWLAEWEPAEVPKKGD